VRTIYLMLTLTLAVACSTDKEDLDSAATNIETDADADDTGIEPASCDDISCDENASCDDSSGTAECVCDDGFEGDGETCENIDECAEGTDDCGDGYDCADTDGAYECTNIDECAEGTDDCGDGYDCADTDGAYECINIDECAEGTDDCDDSEECVDTEGSYECELDSGGHIVLIGHDYYENEATIDRILGNAVLLADAGDTIQIVAYTEAADMVGEYANMLTALYENVEVAFEVTELDDYGALDLSGADVLMIPEQESSDPATLTAVGAAWNDQLLAFVDTGGVVIAADYNGTVSGTWRTVAGLFDVAPSSTNNVSGDSLTIAEPSSPLTIGVDVSTYTAPNGSLSFNGEPSGTAVVTADDGTPVVLHVTH
jgi:hypothetical protein